jgi:hypothetical protein
MGLGHCKIGDMGFDCDVCGYLEHRPVTPYFRKMQRFVLGNKQGVRQARKTEDK